jgi:glucoamylase
MSRQIGFSLFLVPALLAASARGHAAVPGEDVTQWLKERVPTSETYLLRNISPDLPGHKKGVVLAAPWVVPGVQDYRFHWIRDAALVMNPLVSRYLETRDPQAQAKYFARIRDFLNFSKENQDAPEPDGAEKVGLGEVKFNVDGSRYTAWMRPQNDGPALRAITVLRFASAQLSSSGGTDLVRHLYDGSRPGSRGLKASGLLKADLDYVAVHWPDTGFDPWEEVKGHHFYTRLVQRKALRDGAWLAGKLGDPAAAKGYLDAATKLESAIDAHWIPAGSKTPFGTVSTGQVWDSFDRVFGVDYKSTGLDVAVVLGALHAHNELDAAGDRYFAPSDDRILATAHALARAFQKEFPLSEATPADPAGAMVGTPIGRYPKDKYNGLDTKTQGNPWFLATAAFAELYYRCAEDWQRTGAILVNPINLEFLSTLSVGGIKAGETIGAQDPRFAALISSVRALGDTYLRRVKLHEGPQGHLNEQFSRKDGALQGAEDLSWSYASILSAAAHRR